MAQHQVVSITIIGSGAIGPRHAQSVVQCQDARLHCSVDPRDAADAVAATFAVPRHSSIADMLRAGPAPDAAIVCTPNSTHVALSLELLQAGIDVLVEKPIGVDIESAQALVAAASTNHRNLLVGHHRRFNPYITATKLVLSEQRIGRPIAVSGLWALCKPDAYFQPPMEWHARAGIGGPVLINLIHEVDILQYLLGPIVRVHAEQSASQRGFDVEEGAALLLKFESGVVGTFVLLDGTPSLHNFESGTGENPIIPHTNADFYRIFGTAGTFSVGDMKLTIDQASSGRSWSNVLTEERVAVGTEVPFDEQIKHFVRVIRGTEPPRCSGEDGLRALLVCDAVTRAIAEGRPIDIPLHGTSLSNGVKASS